MFSDSEDPSIPTIQLNVENVATGHCQKTLSIMKFFDTGLLILSFDWLVIVDDDTLLRCEGLGFVQFRFRLALRDLPEQSCSRSLKHLFLKNNLIQTKCVSLCTDGAREVVIGERYGYSVSENFGYNYPTGGSGMIFSRKAIEKLVAFCHCPSNNSPDDMIIGVCLKNLDIDVTNSPFLHQARPNDYSPEFLASLKHISFHKHWMIDPYAVYTEWLQDSHVTSQHSEL
ncbi:beta-1,3-glucosyltransferase [Caerostris extrusa]|uniref:Beta-1,3-glucosyltransferase n=1 Tax=Caerostris extrusa TaxID=172846 RepID=A0AAV4NFU9_CAEEX|nr:beta-1,3-glucosyltransferase [Caerostris extrusa]